MEVHIPFDGADRYSDDGDSAGLLIIHSRGVYSARIRFRESVRLKHQLTAYSLAAAFSHAEVHRLIAWCRRHGFVLDGDMANLVCELAVSPLPQETPPTRCAVV